jgi:hypothetical protein
MKYLVLVCALLAPALVATACTKEDLAKTPTAAHCVTNVLVGNFGDDAMPVIDGQKTVLDVLLESDLSPGTVVAVIDQLKACRKL